jgi:hypothetical protein
MIKNLKEFIGLIFVLILYFFINIGYWEDRGFIYAIVSFIVLVVVALVIFFIKNKKDKKITDKKHGKKPVDIGFIPYFIACIIILKAISIYLGKWPAYFYGIVFVVFIVFSYKNINKLL